MVASVAAGTLAEDDDSPMHGVAFDSTVLFANSVREPDEDYDPVDLGDSDGNNAPDFTGIDNFFSQLFRIYNVEDVDIVNNSYGYSGNINDYSELQIRNAFPKTIEEMAQASTQIRENNMFGLLEMRVAMQIKVLITPVQKYYRYVSTFLKFKLTQLL